MHIEKKNPETQKYIINKQSPICFGDYRDKDTHNASYTHIEV